MGTCASEIVNSQSRLCFACGVEPRYHKSYCKKCNNERISNYRKTEIGKERRNARARARLKTEEGKAAQAAHSKKHSTYKVALAKKWAEENKERRRKISVKYFHNRRARLANVGGELTDVEWKAILKKHGGRCVDCGGKENLTRDHVIPVSKGGCNFAFNFAPRCGKCNSRKGSSVHALTISLFDKVEKFPAWKEAPQ